MSGLYSHYGLPLSKPTVLREGGAFSSSSSFILDSFVLKFTAI